MTYKQNVIQRTEKFCEQAGCLLPILLAPMAGACPPQLSVEVSNAGGFGACGVLLMSPEQIAEWCVDFRAHSDGPFQLNIWIPDPTPVRSSHKEQQVRSFLRRFSDAVSTDEVDLSGPNFDAQCEAMLDAKPVAISSIMGIYSEEYVDRMKSQGILWFATATTVSEAVEARDRGADVIVAQGMEAGGHRGTFDAKDAEISMAGLFSLLPAIVDAVDVPVVATGGIADSRGIAAALMLGASAVQIGTGFLRCPESGIPTAWADGIGNSHPHETILTRSFTGRPGRSIATAYARAAEKTSAPDPRPYPIQRALTKSMTAHGRKANDLDLMQAWSGQSGSLSRALSAKELTRELWNETLSLLR